MNGSGLYSTTYSPALQAHLHALQQQLQHYLAIGNKTKCFPPPFKRLQQCLKALTQLLDVKSIDDEELYNDWKAYTKESLRWSTTTLPAYQAATAATRWTIVGVTRAHLVLIIAAAQTYLQHYEVHQENIVEAVIKADFKAFKEQATDELHAPQKGWLYIQGLVEEQYERLQVEQQALEELSGYKPIVADLDAGVERPRGAQCQSPVDGSTRFRHHGGDQVGASAGGDISDDSPCKYSNGGSKLACVDCFWQVGSARSEVAEILYPFSRKEN